MYCKLDRLFKIVDIETQNSTALFCMNMSSIQRSSIQSLIVDMDKVVHTAIACFGELCFIYMKGGAGAQGRRGRGEVGWGVGGKLIQY